MRRTKDIHFSNRLIKTAFFEPIMIFFGSEGGFVFFGAIRRYKFREAELYALLLAGFYRG
jgi:hypothetical protein